MSSRKLLQDILPITRKTNPSNSFNDTHSRFSKETKKTKEIPSSTPVVLERSAPKRFGKKTLMSIGVIFVVCLIVLGCAVFFISAKAAVVIIPRQQSIAVDAVQLQACKDAPCNAISSTTPPVNAAGLLTYEVIQIPMTEFHQVISAADGPLVQTSAQGNVILYNDYSSSPQTIVSGTRLSNSAGLIYRTTKTVVIPGMKKAAKVNVLGQTTVPGSVSVPVVASAPGPSYNILPTDLTGDFNIVSYQGTARYTAFYGRLDPNNSIIGGSSVHSKIVASTTLAQTYANLEQKAQAQLVQESQALIPQGYIMYNGAYSIAYNLLIPQATSSVASGLLNAGTSTSDLADVGIQANFYGIMFRQTDLVKALAAIAMPSLAVDTVFPNDSFNAADLSSLQFNFAGQSTATSTGSGPLIFTLNGSFNITGTFPASTIISQLMGKTVAQSDAIFAGYSTIASAHAILSPFWQHTFPDTPNKIIITTQ